MKRGFLVLFLVMLTGCATTTKQTTIITQPEPDPLEKYRKEIREDFEAFLRQAREIQNGRR